MNLQELKQSIRSKVDMSDIYDKIKRYAADGDSCVTFAHRGCEDEDEITELQADILRENGYVVNWNRPCLWYEVSGWK